MGYGAEALPEHASYNAILVSAAFPWAPLSLTQHLSLIRNHAATELKFRSLFADGVQEVRFELRRLARMPKDR